MIIKSAPFKIITNRPTVQSISVSPSSIELSSIGGTYKPVVNFTPSNVVDRGLTYKSENTNIATVDEEGIITAIGEGTTNIVFTTVDGSKTAKLKVVVKIPTVGLSVNKSKHTFSDVNQTVQLTATLSSDTAKSVVTWSSTNTNVATVDNTGLVTSKSVGVCQIRATTGDLTAITTVTVEKPVIGITTSTYNVDIEVGKSVTVSATVKPSDATDKTLTWSSLNPDIATVDSTGKITGVNAGTCKIRVGTPTNDFIMSHITVNVVVPPTSISVTPTSMTFTREYEINQAMATVLPENATDKTITWASSNTNVAEVESDGSITAISNGTCVITATNSKGYKATINVTVDIAPTNITLDKNDITLTKVNQTATIKANVLPSSANNKSVTWTSSNPSVATVSSSGVVTAKTMGQAIITAKTHNGLVATTIVTVDIPCESITLNQTSISANKIGQTFNLVATALPTAITNPTFTWTSTDEKVAIVTNGLVTITGFGECQIKASYGGKEAICNVKATLIPVNGIEMKANRCTFDKLNQTFQIQASVLPTNATYTELEYNIITENPGFSVSKNGLITCTGILSGTIEVIAHNGVKAVFSVFTDAVNIAIGDYTEKLGNLREAMQTANEKIAQQKMDVASDNINTEIANLNSKVNKELTELDDSLSHIRDDVLAGIEDGVLTDIEKARIEASLDSLRAEKADVDAQYQELYNNTHLVDSNASKPKSNLANSYNTYTTMYNNIVAEIEAMLDLTEINSTHKNMYATKLQNCIQAYQTFKKNALAAINSIAQRKANLLYQDAITYTDATIKVESDRITSAVSTVEKVGNQVSNMQSSITMLAGEISSKVDANGISSVIQQSPESVRIAFNGISSGMTVTRAGIELKTNGNIHTVLQNGRVEVMKKDGTSRLAYMGRNTWSGTSVEGCFIDASTGCTIGIGVNNVMGVAYSRNSFTISTGTTVKVGLNIFSSMYLHNRAIYDVGMLYTNQATIGSNYVEAPILNATSQIKAQTIHVYDWCQAKKFITYTSATYQTRSGETKTISVEKSCVDAITPNTEYIGTASVVDGVATVELPPTLYGLGSTYVVQITPIGDKKIFVSKKDTDNFIVEGEDCEFDYVIKVSLPNNEPKQKRCMNIEKIDIINDSNGIEMDYVE